MQNKKYWLRGLIIGLVGPTTIAFLFILIIALQAVVKGEEIGSLWQSFGMIMVFMVWPITLILTPLLAIVGLAYQRSKGNSLVWKRVFQVLVAIIALGLLRFVGSFIFYYWYITLGLVAIIVFFFHSRKDRPVQKNNPESEYTFHGTIAVGYSLIWSVRVNWPFIKMKFLAEEIYITCCFFFRKHIPYSQIKIVGGLNSVHTSGILGAIGKMGNNVGWVKIVHNAGGFPFVAFRLWLSANQSNAFATISDILKKKGVEIIRT